MSRVRPRAACAAVLVVVSGAGGVTAQGASIAQRTVRASLAINGTEGNGDARHAAVSGKGRYLAFDSDATNLTLDRNGAVRDVFVRDLRGNVTGLVSQAPGGPPADGPSTMPAISYDGHHIAFVSSASNLIAGDTNGVDDIFVRNPSRITLVSASTSGALANGPSSEPDISSDSRYVVFSSLASNLVPGDTNGASDIFVRDLVKRTTRLVSERHGLPANGSSRAPAISGDGRYVTFWSDASNLTPGDHNHVGDVYLADLRTGRLRVVSVNNRGHRQNRSVRAPFVQISDVSRDGKRVVFDSDATNLVKGDTNRSTDVFLRDLRTHRTGRASISPVLAQGDNDSFFPSITPNGRLITFESFADNLVANDSRGEDLFVYDLSQLAPTLIDVPNSGRRKHRERIRQLLQRPTISDDGHVAGFSSTAGNLTAGDDNRHQDVFARIMTPPRARIHGVGKVVSPGQRYSLSADDPLARTFRCRINSRPLPCRRIPAFSRGRYTLRVYAGGPGMLFQHTPAKRRFTIR